MSFFNILLKDEKLQESEIKYQALENMKSIQAQLGSISFIDVISVMREDNPLKPEVFEMENKLHELTVIVSQFINDNLKDAVEVTDDDREDKVDKAVKDAEDQNKIDKKLPDVNESSNTKELFNELSKNYIMIAKVKRKGLELLTLVLKDDKSAEQVAEEIQFEYFEYKFDIELDGNSIIIKGK